MYPEGTSCIICAGAILIPHFASRKARHYDGRSVCPPQSRLIKRSIIPFFFFDGDKQQTRGREVRANNRFSLINERAGEAPLPCQGRAREFSRHKLNPKVSRARAVSTANFEALRNNTTFAANNSRHGATINRRTIRQLIGSPELSVDNCDKSLREVLPGAEMIISSFTLSLSPFFSFWPFYRSRL